MSYMKKFFGIFIDVFFIVISIYILISSGSIIWCIPIGILIICLVLNIIELIYIELIYDETKNKRSIKIDCSNIKQVRIHKQQFDSIEQKADYLILSCIEDGRCIGFKRENGKLIEADFIKGE